MGYPHEDTEDDCLVEPCHFAHIAAFYFHCAKHNRTTDHYPLYFGYTCYHDTSAGRVRQVFADALMQQTFPGFWPQLTSTFAELTEFEASLVRSK